MTSNLAWQNDRLDRKAESALLRKYILAKLNERETTKRKRSFVLNLDAPWGSGKSFFLDNLANELSADGYLVAKVNAWIDDHSDDPLTSVVAAIDAIVGKKSSDPKSTSVNLQAIKRNAGKIVITAALGIGKKWVEKHLGDAAGSVAELASGSPLDETDADEIIMSGVSQASDQVWSDLSASMLKKFETEQAAYGGFRQSFENLVSEMAAADPKNAQIFILIDELDRCRPSYAIQMLERIKHLFSISGAVFIVATDTSQLRESIKAVYGAKFDSERYLHRFFDREYRLEARNTPQFIEEKLRHIVDLAKLNLPKEESLADYVGQCAGRFKLSLRDTEQCIDMLADTIVVWEHKTKIEVAYLLPLLILKKSIRHFWVGLRQASCLQSIVDI